MLRLGLYALLSLVNDHSLALVFFPSLAVSGRYLPGPTVLVVPTEICRASSLGAQVLGRMVYFGEVHSLDR